MGHRTRHGATWRTTKQPSIRHGGTWRAASAAWIRQGGTWVKWWPDLPDRGGPYLYGTIASVGPNICRFNGSAWVSVGGGRSISVNQAALNDGGHILALVGRYYGDSYIWDGASWSASLTTIWDPVYEYAATDGANFFYTNAGAGGSSYAWINQVSLSGSGAIATVQNTAPFGYSYFWGLAASRVDYPNITLYASGVWDSPVSPPIVYNNGGYSGSYISVTAIGRQLDDRVWHGGSAIWYETGVDAFTQLASCSGGAITSIVALPDGRVWAAGNFTSIDGVSAAGLAAYDGTTWSQVGGGLANIAGMSYHQDKLWILAGSSLTTRSVYTWDGTTLAFHSSWSGETVKGIL